MNTFLIQTNRSTYIFLVELCKTKFSNLSFTLQIMWASWLVEACDTVIQDHSYGLWKTWDSVDVTSWNPCPKAAPCSLQDARWGHPWSGLGSSPPAPFVCSLNFILTKLVLNYRSAPCLRYHILGSLDIFAYISLCLLCYPYLFCS